MSSCFDQLKIYLEVAVTKKSNTIRTFPCTVLQCPVVLTSLKATLRLW